MQHCTVLSSNMPSPRPPFPNFVGCWHLADTESNTNRSDKVKHHSFLRGGSLALIIFPLKLLRCDGAADQYSACCQACPLHSALMGSIDIHRSEWLDLNRLCSAPNKNSSLTLGNIQAQAGIWKIARARRRGSSGFLFTTRVGWGGGGHQTVVLGGHAPALFNSPVDAEEDAVVRLCRRSCQDTRLLSRLQLNCR